MVIDESSVHNIIGGVENMGRVRLHNHKRKLKQRFDIIRKLGQGTYGKVQLGINKETGEEVAIKTIKKSKIEAEADLIRIRREIQIMSSIQHQNIIRIYEVFENNDKIVLVMEYAAGGELYDYLSEKKILTEQDARRLFRQIAMAVYYCHKYQICHRDLKLENILLDEAANAKIADFGLSNVFNENSRLSTFCGSPLYASPEIVKGTPYQGPEVDCWSLGVLLYTLVYGAMPFDGSNFKTLVTQISHSHYFEPENPSPASSLIKELLTVCPTKRATIQNVCSHRWLNEDHSENCLDVAKDLATQTPVRLDLLLSLATEIPKISSLNSPTQHLPIAKINKSLSNIPSKSFSVDSLMNLSESEITNKKAKTKPSEVCVKKKKSLDSTIDKLADLNTCDTLPLSTIETSSDTNLNSEEISLEKSDHSTKKIKTVDSAKRVRSDVGRSRSFKKPSPDSSVILKNENSMAVEPEISNIPRLPDQEVKAKSEPRVPDLRNKEVIPKTSTNERIIKISLDTEEKQGSSSSSEKEADLSETSGSRRNSRIYETAEKFKQLSASFDEKFNEKSKQIFIPGVNVAGVKKSFERKSSLGSIDSISEMNRLKCKVTDLFRDKKFENIDNRRESLTTLSGVEEMKRRENERKQAINTITSVIGKPPLMRKSSGIYEISRSNASSGSNTWISENSASQKDLLKASQIIARSPREFIIPIAVEGSGYILPKPSNITTGTDSRILSTLDTSRNRLKNFKTFKSELSSNNDTGSSCSAYGKDNSDYFPRRLHNLRSSRSSQPSLEAADSVSSEDDDDGFELLTAENLFSTLLSRVQSLTQRLNINDNYKFRNSFFDRFDSPSRRSK